MGKRKLLDLREAQLSNNYTISVFSTVFSPEIQNRALYQLLGRQLTLSQPKAGQAILSRCLLLMLHEGGPGAPPAGEGSFLDCQGGPQGWPPLGLASCPLEH